MLRPLAPNCLREYRPFQPLVHPTIPSPPKTSMMADAKTKLRDYDRKKSSSPRIVATNYGAISSANAPGDQHVVAVADGGGDAKSRRDARRSQVAHSLLRQQSESEMDCMAPGASAKVQTAIRVSLVVNVILAVAKTYAAFASGSLAVLSSLVDSILDLTSQWLFWYSDKHMHTPNVNYPAGRRRLEPIAVIIAATLMGMAAIEVVQKSIETLVSGFGGSLPDLDMSAFTIAVLVCAILIKIVLWWICSRIASNSSSADALAQDHRNDVFSNTVAVTTSLLAQYRQDWWYADSIGAIAISVYIAFSWLATGKEQVERLIGLRADTDFIEQIHELADRHHPLMKSDIVRAYHFGNNYLVELEVILPENMCVREAHDISLALQNKVEELDNVERAFVHVDYLSRDYDEHKDPTIRRDST